MMLGPFIPELSDTKVIEIIIKIGAISFTGTGHLRLHRILEGPSKKPQSLLALRNTNLCLLAHLKKWFSLKRMSLVRFGFDRRNFPNNSGNLPISYRSSD